MTPVGGTVVAVQLDPHTLASVSWEDQEKLGKPGNYQAFLVSYGAGELFPEAHEQMEYDFNCPGCGQVRHLRAPNYVITELMTCMRPVFFSCCETEWTLETGVWRRRK